MAIDPKLTKRAQRYVERARRSAEANGHELSGWEDEFLGSLTERLSKYGKAFSDPDKGAMCSPLSMLQGMKLKEISGKKKPAAAKEYGHDTPKPRKERKPLKRKTGLGSKPMKHTPEMDRD